MLNHFSSDSLNIILITLRFSTFSKLLHFGPFNIFLPSPYMIETFNRHKVTYWYSRRILCTQARTQRAIPFSTRVAINVYYGTSLNIEHTGSWINALLTGNTLMGFSYSDSKRRRMYRHISSKCSRGLYLGHQVTANNWMAFLSYRSHTWKLL
jgi:hypothetical protein